MILTVLVIYFTLASASAYSPAEDDKTIRSFLSELPTDHAVVARKLVHKANWASAGTIATAHEIQGFPMVNIISIADSAKDAKSTGNIYFLLTPLDFTEQDLDSNNKLTFMISDDQNLSCTQSNIDPMEPTCSRAIFSGKVNYLKTNEAEFQSAKISFVSRHPAAARWNSTHEFNLCKLEISNIFVLDWYGGPHNVKPQDYYNANFDQYDLSLESKNKLVKYLDWADSIRNAQSRSRLRMRNELKRKFRNTSRPHFQNFISYTLN